MRITLAIVATIVALCSAGGPSALAGEAGAPSPQTTVKLDHPFEQVWGRTLKFLEMRAITPSSVDADSGFLLATSSSQANVFLKCAKGKGKLVDSTYELSISVERVGDAATSVTVVFGGDASYTRRRHFLFIPTNVNKKPADCASSGFFEAQLFNYLRASSASSPSG